MMDNKQQIPTRPEPLMEREPLPTIIDRWLDRHEEIAAWTAAIVLLVISLAIALPIVDILMRAVGAW